ncbi:MAG: hypothetical protein ACI8T1_004640 [Verrucomicrobiales bacterium]
MLLNDPTFLEASRVLAEQMMETSQDDDSRMRQAFRIITGRLPKPNELAILLDSLQMERERFQTSPEAAKAFIHVGDSPVSDATNPTEWAAWTFICSLVFNLDETITQH